MKKIILTIKAIDTLNRDAWTEEYAEGEYFDPDQINSDKDAHAFGTEMLEAFNSSLRPGEAPRALVSAKLIQEPEPQPEPITETRPARVITLELRNFGETELFSKTITAPDVVTNVADARIWGMMMVSERNRQKTLSEKEWRFVGAKLFDPANPESMTLDKLLTAVNKLVKDIGAAELDAVTEGQSPDDLMRTTVEMKQLRELRQAFFDYQKEKGANQK